MENTNIKLSDRFIFMKTAQSTNDEARKLGIGNTADGMIVVAEQQTASRGRLGRKWESPAGGLWFSMVSRLPAGLDFDISQITRISLAAGVAVLEALDWIFLELKIADCQPGLGWPNDLLVDSKKIAGILCEACFTGGYPFVIVGVGLNLNNYAALLPPEIAPFSTSVIDIAGTDFHINSALVKTTQLLDNVIPHVLHSESAWSETLEKWRARCILLGREVKISAPGDEPYKATAIGIDESGRLIVRDGGGAERIIEHGETTLAR